MPHIKQFDHIGITVADLDKVTAFFVDLGLEIEAVHVGHDLTRGTSHFTRTPKAVQETAA